MRNELIALFGKHRSRELEISDLPPFLRRYLALTTAHTDAKPGLLLTAFLPFCAVNVGNRVYMLNNSTRIYPNVWSCVIGPSSISRKTTALRFGSYTLKPHEEALQTAPLKEYEEHALTLTGTTLSKLMSYLAVNPSRLFVHNELAGWLHEMNKSYNAGYKQTVTELYDNVDRTIANRERTERIIKPALSIASASTEGWLYKTMMDGAEQLGGFLQRMLFYVVRNVNLEDVDLVARAANNLESELASFDTDYFRHWRELPANTRLELSEDALNLRNELYEERYRQYFAFQNDALMSYFTRIYDGYFFKFCILFHLAEMCEVGDSMPDATTSHSGPRAGIQSFKVSSDSDGSDWGDGGSEKTGFRVKSPQQPTSCLSRTPKPGMTGNASTSGVACASIVSGYTAWQAFLLCDFYMENTIPLLEIMDEQDKLAGERKLVDIIINKYAGKAPHSALLNSSHMKKRDFKECIETLIEREAIVVETYQSNTKPGKIYVLAPEIMDSWSKK